MSIAASVRERGSERGRDERRRDEPTGDVVRRLIAIAVVVVSAGLVVPAVVIPLRRHALTGLFAPDLGAGLVFAVVGAFLLVRGATRVIAVIMCVQGLSTSLTTLTGVLRDDAAAHGPLHGFGLWVGWTNNLVWLVGVSLIIPLVLLLPDGRLWRRWCRWVIVATGAVVAVFVVVGPFAAPKVIDTEPTSFSPNPTRVIPAPQSVVDAFSGALFIALIVLIGISLGAIVSRRRHATGVQRAQLTCMFFGGAIVVLIIGIGQTVGQSYLDTWVTFAISLFAVAPLPASIGVAVLRYRLYDIDRVISRTVTYGLVLAVLAGVYAGIVIGLTALVPKHLGQLGVVVATLTVTVVAVPLTRRVRRLVDRRFNRRRFDAERVVAGFAAALRARPDRGDVPDELVTAVRHTVQPAHASVWVVPQ